MLCTPMRRLFRSKRARKRRKLNVKVSWPFVTMCLTVMNVGVGLARSPLTSPIKATITGTEAYDKVRVQHIIEGLQGRPFASINAFQVESELQDASEVYEANFKGNIFGRVHVKMTYRRPVATIVGASGLALDSQGTVYLSRQILPEKVKVILPQDAQVPNLTLASRWIPGSIAALCDKLPPQIRKYNVKVLFDPDRGLCMDTEPGCRIVFQHVDGLDRMLNVLEDTINKEPNCLDKYREINVSSAVVERLPKLKRSKED